MKTVVTLAAFAAFLPLVPLQATTGKSSQIVAFRDLDLSSSTDRRTLDRRIFRAAADVCGNASDLDLSGQNDARKCRTQTANAARAQVDGQLAAANRSVRVAALNQ